MGIALNDFKAKVSDVARPNRFLLSFTSPTGGADAETISYFCKGAQVPGRTIGDLILNWQGMQSKIAGDPTFEDLTLTFYNDYEQLARKTIEDWMILINNQFTNEREDTAAFKVDATLQQLGRKQGEVLGTFKMFGFFPKMLDPIDLNMESVDTVGEFGCTFSLDYWERT
jgi:hypothetical protein